MSRDICVYLDFLTQEHRLRIQQAAQAAGFTPYFFTSDQFDQAKACLQHCEILYGHAPALLRSAPATLKWCCTPTAGVDLYCADPTLFANPDCILTNSNGYGVTIAEHVVMVTLMLLRQMPTYLSCAVRHEWGAPMPIRSIRDGSFTVLGTGNIGVNVAQRLHGMGAASVLGLSRSGRPAEGFDQVLPISCLEDVLPQTQVLIMALPSTPETVNLLNRERISLLPETACVINVGRGTALDQDALAQALNSGRLAGAPAGGPPPVERQKHDHHPPRLRQHDPGLYLRSQCGDVLPGPCQLRRRPALERSGGPRQRLLSGASRAVRERHSPRRSRRAY